MKKTFFFLVLTFIMSWNSLSAQTGGTDYIVVLDNGTSMTNARFTSMKLGAIKVIEQLLACNPLNRIAVVHYGAGIYNTTNSFYTPRIYIEYDFTNGTFMTQAIQRRLDNGDHFNEALGLIGNALDGVSNANIVSPQTTLNRDPANPMRVIVFTDAERNTGGIDDGSYLVNYDFPALNTPDAFKNVLDFKIARQAKFTMVHLTPDALATAAAASIASEGGSYNGPVETNVDDPDYGVPYRSYYQRSYFDISPAEADYWSHLAFEICNNSGWGNINFKYEPNGCGISQAQTISGSYILPAGATFSAFKLVARDVVTGQDYSVNFAPVMTSSTSFYYSLQPSDFTFPAGTVGKFVFLLSMQYEYQGAPYDVISWNGHPYFDYDLYLTTAPNCGVTRMSPSSIVLKENGLKISPNPTNGAFKVILDKKIESGNLQIMDLNGNIVYSKPFKGQNIIDIDIHSQKEGIYIVKVISLKNEIYTEKIIKK
ncbi:Por secretion system C-terminal sorting domain-containing protein [Chryseobacterium taichungense]|uniref:Por secretion system C-terminal sorting domain-containing protein n=1 Tax=Chryseobacterium taichungense TaxID=295069 RepID=A0A1H7Y2R6_9FLAO|nr:T9SS type A sorting domain-containing protein [Chryseobacterium taichungense]SEM40303.1 Por secretion system C-terminal sorting domain-containing protein [Chryseobacterium taichungense]